MCFVVDSLVKLSALLGKGKDSVIPEARSFLKLLELLKKNSHRFYFSKMSKVYSTHDKGETFRTILSSLDEVGYDVEWQLHNSKYHVPQNRERVYIVGHLRGQRTRQVFPLGNIDNKSDKSKKTDKI